MKFNGKSIGAIVLILVVILFLVSMCGTDNKNSSYSLHNKDGSLNMQYINDMNDYFKKHPDKLPK